MNRQETKRASKYDGQVCVVCGKLIVFPDGVSPYKKKTCSQECYATLLSGQRKGQKRVLTPKWLEALKLRRGKPHIVSAAGRASMKEAQRKYFAEMDENKRQEYAERAKMSSLAAQRSEVAGRFPSNVHAKHWKILSPQGITYEFDNMHDWARNNYSQFGFTSPNEAYKVYSGFSNLRKTLQGTWNSKGKPPTTYKGWRLLAFSNENKSYVAAKQKREQQNKNKGD